MKKLIITSILALLVSSGAIIKAQDRPDEYLGLPGDNLNLYAVMNLFQESKTLEEFERKLNEENSRINNLDLNGDNLIDYIMVTDYVDGDVHTIVLQVALNRNEKQDVAAFTVERFRNGSVQIQLIGDEALYGSNYIIEPIYDDNANGTPNPGYSGNRANITVVSTTTFEIAAWPMIRFIYRPDYRVWRSSWYWGYYPSYWHPWSPFYWHYYYGYHHNWYPEYYRHYRHWERPRYHRYNDFYYSSIRSHSPSVSIRIKEGNYRSSYSHPEQRRDGEALYSRTHSGRNSTVTSGTSRRSTNTEIGKARTSPSSGQNAGRSRRSTVTERSINNPSSNQNSGRTGRSSTTVNERRVNTPSSDQNNGRYGRSSTTVTGRSNKNQSSEQNIRTSRRSSPPVSERTISRPESSKRGEIVRSSGKSESNVSSPARRSTRENKAQSSGNRNEKPKESGNSRSSRRK